MNIHRGIPSLQSLCQAAVANSLAERENCFDLILPTKLKVAVAESFDSVIQVGVINDVQLAYSVHKSLKA